MRLTFFEAPAFSRVRERYLDDEAFRAVQRLLLAAPESGALMPGTGGFRKLRWKDAGRGKGTRGGLRIIYFHLPDEARIWLFTIYDKDEMDDLTPDEKRLLKRAITAELAKRRS